MAKNRLLDPKEYMPPKNRLSGEGHAITEEIVWRAADKLHRKYIHPTVEAIRRELGGGSPNTIIKYLGTWREKRQSEAAPIFGALPKEVGEAMEDVWRRALTAATEALRTEETAYKEANARLERDVQFQAADLLEKTRAIDVLKTSVAGLETRLVELDRLLASERTASQERLSALTRLQTQYDELQRSTEQQLALARDDRQKAEEALTVERQRGEARESVYRQEKEATASKLNELHGQIQAAKADGQRRQEVLQAQLDAVREARESLTEELNRTKARLDELQTKLSTSENDLATAQAGLSAMNVRFSEDQQTISGLRQDISKRDEAGARREREIGELQGAISVLRHQIKTGVDKI